MQLTRLTLTQFRAFEQATFKFHPGMNLLVGINGVGKSSVLDALRVILSQALPKFTSSRTKPLSFDESDITQERATLTAELEFEVENVTLTYFIHQYREEYGDSVVPLSEEQIERLDRRDRIKERREQQEAYNLSEQNSFIPDEKNVPKQLKTANSQPIVVYFSTRRSLPTMKAPSKQISVGGQAAAFADALTYRELRLREFAEWWLVQEALANDENPLPNHRLDALKSAVAQFLDTFTHLRAVRDPQTTLLLDKEGVTLDVRQLSDGERSVLALVLDLARRLSQANPTLEDSLQGKAVVLIDELDLHLHPTWQRTIVAKLTQTFPNCQFIATTHSPQIVGEVKPPGLSLIAKEGDRVVAIQEGLQGFGLDSSWILEHLMGTASRNASTQAQINQVEDALEEGELDLARSRLEILRTMLHGDDGEVIRLEASINNLEALADEVDLDDEMDSEEE